MKVDYDHSRNIHTVGGASAALSAIFEAGTPTSLLDVGCGTGTWLAAAIQMGVPDVLGIDGVDLTPEHLLFPAERFMKVDLGSPVRLGRRFAAALCLEVAEHLESTAAMGLIDTLTAHSDLVVFSAACPRQIGQHHVNCQWPSYWQELFNAHSYSCWDEVRWRIWNDARIEPWYRQNLFIARRDESNAGDEPRLLPVVHPEICGQMVEECRSRTLRGIRAGEMGFVWSFDAAKKALLARF
jgi:SAM-dependent methyltransferase